MKKVILGLFCCVIMFNGISQLSQTNCSNEKNPLDYIGKNHNEGMDYFIEKYPKASIEFFKENQVAIISDFFVSKGIDTKYFQELVSNKNVIEKCGKVGEINNENPLAELELYYKNSLISKENYTVVKKIFDLVYSIDEQIASKNGDANSVFQIFYDDMVKLENTFSDLKEEDQMFCYAVSAIARHSVWYWLNESTKSVSNWNVPNSKYAGMKCSWGGLGGSDVGGAVAGAVRFGVLAVFGGPVGWGACGIAALAGGLGASVGYSIACWFL